MGEKSFTVIKFPEVYSRLSAAELADKKFEAIDTAKEVLATHFPKQNNGIYVNGGELILSHDVSNLDEVKLLNFYEEVHKKFAKSHDIDVIPDSKHLNEEQKQTIKNINKKQNSQSVFGGFDILVIDSFSILISQVEEGLADYISTKYPQHEALIPSAIEDVLKANGDGDKKSTFEAIRKVIEKIGADGEEIPQAAFKIFDAIKTVSSFIKKKAETDVNYQEKGKKPELSYEETKFVKENYGKISAFADLINKFRDENEIDASSLVTRGAGGNIPNKLDKIVSIRGKDNVTGVVFGVIGGAADSIGRDFLLAEMEKRGYGVENFGTEKSLCKENMVFLFRDGERTILTGHVDTYKDLFENILDNDPNFVKNCIAKLDNNLIELSSEKETKFGFRFMEAVVDASIELNKEITLTPMSNVPDEKNKALFLKAFRSNQCSLTTLNEDEAINHFTDIKGHKVTSKDDPVILDVIKIIQEELKQKEKNQGNVGTQPVVSLTLGKHGAYAITTDHVMYLPINDKIPVVDKTGAGDAFAAAFLALRGEARVNNKQHFDASKEMIRFTENQLMNGLIAGNAASEVVLQTIGGQPDQSLTRGAVFTALGRGVSSAGKFSGHENLQEQQMYQIKG